MNDEENTMNDQTPESDTGADLPHEVTREIPEETPEAIAEEAPEETPEQSATEPAVRRGFAAGLHPVNVLHLVLGVAFLGMVVNWALIESGAVETSGLRWLLPIPWVAAGAAGLIATAPRLRGR
jgi:hypothetical protein